MFVHSNPVPGRGGGGGEEEEGEEEEGEEEEGEEEEGEEEHTRGVPQHGGTEGEERL